MTKIFSPVLVFCILFAAGSNIGSQYRSDVFLDYNQYPEAFSRPSGGGRIHYTLESKVGYEEAKMPFVVELTYLGSVNTIVLGINQSLPSELNWIHCDISSTNMLWVSLHTNSDDVAKSLKHITVKDNENKVMANTELPSLNKDYGVKNTYTTTTGNYKLLIVHVHNYSSGSKSVTDMIVDGKSTKKSFSIGANEHLVFTFPVEKFQGDVWTVNLVMSDGNLVGNGGRVTKEHFPVEVWQRSKDCPFPQTNVANFQILTEQFNLDTLYLADGYYCKGNPEDILKNAPAHDYYLMVDHGLDDTSKTPSPLEPYSSSTAAISCADESDSKISDTVPIWQLSMQFRNRLPHFMTYQGGKTYSYAGTFSGITDIQGKDFYVAGCAPHVTTFQSTMRIQGSYDYLKNTRANHMPLTVWGYSQFIFDWAVQPNSNEVMIQLASVVAAGCKGLMLFQIDPSYAGSAWHSDVMRVIKPIETLRHEFREGDSEGAIFEKDDSDDQSTVGVIRSRDKLVIVVINTDASGYNDVLCYSHISDHWKFNNHTINKLKIYLPSDLKHVSNFQEVTKNGTGPATGVIHQFSNGEVILKNIALGEDPTVVRFFVIS